MPGKTFMYKALNTFIDDLFAFVIKMPWLHRLACLRDDLVFFVYLYQRYMLINVGGFIKRIRGGETSLGKLEMMTVLSTMRSCSRLMTNSLSRIKRLNKIKQRQLLRLKNFQVLVLLWNRR
jgi:hypothetical protein